MQPREQRERGFAGRPVVLPLAGVGVEGLGGVNVQALVVVDQPLDAGGDQHLAVAHRDERRVPAGELHPLLVDVPGVGLRIERPHRVAAEQLAGAGRSVFAGDRLEVDRVRTPHRSSNSHQAPVGEESLVGAEEIVGSCVLGARRRPGGGPIPEIHDAGPALGHRSWRFGRDGEIRVLEALEPAPVDDAAVGKHGHRHGRRDLHGFLGRLRRAFGEDLELCEGLTPRARLGRSGVAPRRGVGTGPDEGREQYESYHSRKESPLRHPTPFLSEPGRAMA